MDMIDILGGLLGRKSSQKSGESSRGGPDIFGNVLGGKKSRPKSPPTTKDLERQAEELEDLLNVSNDHHQRRRSSPTPSSPPPQWSPPQSPHASPPASPPPQANANDRALILVKAMINAAKADGQVDAREQQAILEKFKHSDARAVQFLREEMQKPLDLPAFAASVPLGLEQQVYSVSLMAIQLDSGEEAKYLLDLSQALRLPPETREQIHQRYGAPSIY